MRLKRRLAGVLNCLKAVREGKAGLAMVSELETSVNAMRFEPSKLTDKDLSALIAETNAYELAEDAIVHWASLVDILGSRKSQNRESTRESRYERIAHDIVMAGARLEYREVNLPRGEMEGLRQDAQEPLFKYFKRLAYFVTKEADVIRQSRLRGEALLEGQEAALKAGIISLVEAARKLLEPERTLIGGSVVVPEVPAPEELAAAVFAAEEANSVGEGGTSTQTPTAPFAPAAAGAKVVP